jgi:hypothetical protein
MAQRALDNMRPDLESKSIGVRFMPEREEESGTENVIFPTRREPNDTGQDSATGLYLLALLVGVACVIGLAALILRHTAQ